MFSFIQEFTEKYRQNCDKEKILQDLFNNKQIIEEYPQEIRRVTIIGQIANQVFKNLKMLDSCKIMAIGDIEYFGQNKKQWENLIADSLQKIKIEQLKGYDLNGQGSLALRKGLLKYMNNFYQLPTKVLTKLAQQIIPCYWASDGFSMIINSLKNSFAQQKINFIYPEASFMVIVKIAENFGSSLQKITKPNKGNFFITIEQIEQFYKKKLQKLPSFLNIYYFIPVGNPTGQKIESASLFKIMAEINKKDELAIFILDNVYVPLLKKEEAVWLFKKIFENKKIFNRTIFCESFSKSLWLTGFRVGWLWTLNSELFAILKNNIVLQKAGFSKVLDQTIVNLLDNSLLVEQFIQKSAKFISQQRTAFGKIVSQQYWQYFDLQSSPKIKEQEGVFLLLKLKKGYSAQEVFCQTGIIGVPIFLSDGEYIRYSFGNIDDNLKNW